MDALLLTLLLTLILDQGSATQNRIARFGDTDRTDAARIGGLALMVAVNAVVAAMLGALMAALLMPDAQLLFLAFALLFGGIGLLVAPFRKHPAMIAAPGHDGWRVVLGLALRRAGENAAFATAGVVAFTDAPLLAAVGATLGGWVALVPPLALGRLYCGHLLLRLFQGLSGLILLCIGIGCAVTALRIV